jgi:hypothetical protein
MGAFSCRRSALAGLTTSTAFSSPRRAVERLPAYPPELNPVEYIWGYGKQHELPNFRPNNLPSLAAKPVAHCAACGGVPASSAPAGNKPSSPRYVSILYKSQSFYAQLVQKVLTTYSIVLSTGWKIHRVSF